MRYAQIRNMDISNGEGVGVALFVQGCHLHCHNCFNKETWDFKGGKEWTGEAEEQFIKLIDRPFIKRVSILGGEPLAYENLPSVYNLLHRIKKEFPDKKIWLWTGYELSIGNFDQTVGMCWDNGLLRNYIIGMCDYVVDGRYVDSMRDITLKFKGSSNQRVIDVKETIRANDIVLYEGAQIKGSPNK